ncbi:MAG: hypothetical protein IKD64_07435, partial [Lachnospiraceae bacterium]|nr:hypothetical protein [Lachnospiraceae bacterium]
EEASAHAKERLDQAQAEAGQIIAKAQQQAEDERNRIVAETGEEIERLAKDAAKRAIFESTSDAFDSFLDAAEGKNNE